MPADQDDALLLSNQVCFALYAAQHAMTRVYRRLLDELGLTYPQYLVLLLLWEADGRSVKELGDRLGLDSGTLTPLLKRMEGQGLVRRGRDPTDERVVRVTLTTGGAALRERARCVPGQVLASSGRSVEELVAMREELKQLRAALDAAIDGNTG